MLKKAGTIAALATAGLLAVSPLAFAGEGHEKSSSGDRGNVDVTDQENEQESAQGNGILNGNNILSGNAIQVCEVNVNALNNVVGAVAILLAAAGADQSADTEQGGGDCNAAGVAVGQTTTQDAENENG